MPRPHLSLDNQLAAALHARSNADERVLRALESVQARLAEGTVLPDLCTELQKVLSRITGTDPGLSPLQQQWAALGTLPSQQLQSELERQQRLLELLLECVDEIAAVASAERDRLKPELDTAARARRMCAAYAAAGRHQ
jgi:hypothetical protein